MADKAFVRLPLFSFLIFTVSILLSSQSFAEYRVFLLRIMEKPLAPQPNDPNIQSNSNTPAPSETPPTTNEGNNPTNSPPKPPDIVVREFPSTLDPLQYPTYYPLKSNQYVVYIDTWRCRGRTNDKPLCPNPRARTEDNPESSFEPNPSENPPQETTETPPPVPQNP